MVNFYRLFKSMFLFLVYFCQAICKFCNSPDINTNPAFFVLKKK